MRFFPLIQSGNKVKAAPYGKTGIGFTRYDSNEELFRDFTQYGNESRVNIYSINGEAYE
jgi:hypothetical protein